MPPVVIMLALHQFVEGESVITWGAWADSGSYDMVMLSDDVRTHQTNV